MSEKKETKITKRNQTKPRIAFSISDYVSVTAAITKGEDGDIQLFVGQKVKIEKILDDLLK